MNSKALDEAENVVLEDNIPFDVDSRSVVSSLEDADADPAFGEEYGRVTIDNDSLGTKANITEDGRSMAARGTRE